MQASTRPRNKRMRQGRKGLRHHFQRRQKTGPGSGTQFPVSFVKPLATERMAYTSSILACADKSDRPGSAMTSPKIGAA
jgi:hypothetical protein